jgi:transposase
MSRATRCKKTRVFEVQKPSGQLAKRVQVVGPNHFGIVSVDCAKVRSKFLFCDFYGNVLIEPTPLEHTQAGFRAVTTRVRQTMRDHDIRDVVVAIESTGTYHRPVQDAFRRAEFETRLVHPFASKQFRQPANPGNKTDDTDLAAIFRAAVNGFGLLQPIWPNVYLELQQLGRQRRDLVRKTTTLRCQIKETLHQLMPGYVELFGAHFFDTAVALPLAHVTGSAQAVLEAGSAGLTHLIPDGILYRQSTLAKVLNWAHTASPAQNPSQLFRESLDRFADDFRQKTREIRSLEQRSANYLAHTPYLFLLALPGISVVSAVELGGEQGPLEHYANANHITGRAGLCPSRYQSDQVDHANGPLRRRANRRLRAALLRIADNLIRHNHHYKAQADRWLRLGKDPRWIHVKIAKSFSRLAFVLLTGKCLFPHPACQPRHSIYEKLLAFHTEHQTNIHRALEDIDLAERQLPARTRQEENQMLRRQLEDPRSRRRRGPVALAKIIPLVLARLGMRAVQSEAEGKDPD